MEPIALAVLVSFFSSHDLALVSQLGEQQEHPSKMQEEGWQSQRKPQQVKRLEHGVVRPRSSNWSRKMM
jgi:hypothetical protein